MPLEDYYSVVRLSEQLAREEDYDKQAAEIAKGQEKKDVP
jgi:hypothetical protein